MARSQRARRPLLDLPAAVKVQGTHPRGKRMAIGHIREHGHRGSDMASYARGADRLPFTSRGDRRFATAWEFPQRYLMALSSSVFDLRGRADHG